MKELIWIIIFLSIIYLLNLVFANNDISKHVINPNDILTPAIIPHSEITNPIDLPIDKNIINPIKPIPNQIQPDVPRAPQCDVILGSDRPQFKNNFEASFNEVGADINPINENNPILTGIKTSLNNNVLMSYEDNLYQDRYQELNPQMVITDTVLKSDKFPNNLVFDNKNYNFMGLAYNEYYNQYYLLYENVIKSSTLELPSDNLDYINYKVSEYILAKMNDDQLTISHIIGPRNKINYNDIVYFSFGNFQLGPLYIKKV